MSSWWTIGTTIAILLLIFISEEAVTMPHYKMAIRSIISILVLFLISGLKQPEKQDVDDTRLKLQYINELSSRVTQEIQKKQVAPEMIIPNLDDADVLDLPVPTAISSERYSTSQETSATSSATQATSPREKKRPLQLKLKFIDFIMDRGCTTHVTNDMTALYHLRLSRADRQMGRIEGCVRGTGVRINGIGTLNPLGDVLVAPYIAQNLISISQLQQRMVLP